MEVYSDEWQGIKEKKKAKVTINMPAKVGPCPRCKQRKTLTKDHIIPQAILRAMGMTNNDPCNLQWLCERCNVTKGSQLDPKNPKTLPLMEYYLRRWRDMYVVARPRRKYVFRMLPVQSLTPDTYHFVESRKALQSIYLKQKGVQM